MRSDRAEPIATAHDSHGSQTSQLLTPRTVATLLAAIAYIGLVANSDEASALAHGQHLDLTKGTAGLWQYVREAITLALLGLFANTLVRRNRSRRECLIIPVGGAAVGLFLLSETLATLMRGQVPASGVLPGLRFVVIAGLAVFVRQYSSEERRQLLVELAWALVPLLVIESVIAAYQVYRAPPTLGLTQFGTRPWGTYASANNLGLAMLGILAVILLARIRYWWLCVPVIGYVCLMTGSRTAILGFVLVITGAAVARWRSRMVAVPFACLAFYIMYVWVSTEAVSGRTITGETRFGTWAIARAGLHGSGWIFGEGVGYGTNSLVAMLGTTGTPSAAISDSAFVAALVSTGAAGFLLYVCVYIKLWRAVTFDRRIILLPMLGLTLVTFNVPEVSPFNVLVAVAIGCSLPEPVHREVGDLPYGSDQHARTINSGRRERTFGRSGAGSRPVFPRDGSRR